MNVNKEKIQRKWDELNQKYVLDKTELGEVLAVTSIALLFISVHAAISVNESLEDVEELNRNFDQVRGIMASDSFDSSMEAVETTAVEISSDFEQVHQNFQALENELEGLEEVEHRLEDRYRFYQWMVLLSIIGLVSGISIIYI